MKQNQLINALRGIGISWIVLFHYTMRYNTLFPNKSYEFPIIFNNGKIGVTIFFIISGYLMGRYLYFEKSIGIKTSLKFFINKYWRLWPLYAISVVLIYAILCFYPLPSRNVNFLDFIMNFFFINHFGIPNVDGAHWFLSTLISLTFLLAIFLCIRKVSVRLKFFDVYVCFCIAFFIIKHLFQLDFGFLSAFVSKWQLNFLFGVYSYMFFKGTRNRINKTLFVVLGVFCCLSNNLQGCLFIFLILASIYLEIKHLNLYNKIVSYKLMKFFIWVGNVSFCWYLIHQNIGYVFFYYLYSYMSDMPIVLILFVLSFTFISAFILNKLIRNIPTKLFKL